MIKLSYKKFWFIPTIEYYYWYDNKSFWFFDVVTISQLPNKFNNKSFKESIFNTWITNLWKDFESLFNSFSKTTRNEIRRAEKEWITYHVKNNPSKNDLLEYLDFYNRFLKTKHLPTITSENILKYIWNVFLTYSKIDEEILGYHLYIYDLSIKKVRLLHSCSLFRQKKWMKNVVNLIWYANKGLHYWDMNYFKEKWFIEYDRWWLYLWEIDKQKINIDKFKLSFSPNIVEHYNYERIPLMFKVFYKIKLLIWKIF